jgi:hypothetical protein
MQLNTNWYPEKILVGPEGTPGTYEFMENIFHRQRLFSYAELGIYKGDTARNVCERFPNCTLHLFDYHERVLDAQLKLSEFKNRIYYYGNSQRYNDSYNWNLVQLLKNNQGEPIFDYCFFDGAHTFAVDALSFFLCDRLMRIGGYLDFDDYSWSLRGSSLDPSKVPQIAEQYTEEQIDSKQVALIVDQLIKPDVRYKEIVKDKIFQKISR